jgi:hypothetical protein
MYHCCFTQHGRIVVERDLEVDSLPKAILIGHQLLEGMAASQGLDGLEIWGNTKLLYGAAGQISWTSSN